MNVVVLTASENGRITNKSISFQWVIKNFCVCKNIKDRLHKSVGGEWFIEMYPRGYLDINKDFLSIFCWHTKDSYRDIKATLTAYILDSKNNKVKLDTLTSLFSKNNRYGFPRFASTEFVMNRENNVLVNNTLTIQCEIYEEDSLLIKKRDEVAFEVLECPYDCHTRLGEFDQFETFFRHQKHGDVTFQVGDTEIQGHKAILIARSAVFEAMFTHNMRENNQNVVKINDITPGVFNELLRFVYSGKCKKIDCIAKDLLIAADKYAIEGLKTICENLLCEKISDENALDCLLTADIYNCKALKSRTMDFISSQSSNVVNKPEFQIFGQQRPDLMCEITKKIFNESICKKRKIE